MPEVEILKVKSELSGTGFEDFAAAADKAFKKVGEQAKGLQSSFNALAKSTLGLSAAIVAAGTAFGVFAIKTAQSLDRVDKMSQKLGMARKEFQEWDYIASQTGTNIEGLAASMRTLTNEADKNGDAFKKLGIDVKNSNGQLKNQDELFFEVIKKLQSMPAGVERSKVAMQLLGRSAADLAPLLNAGAGSMEELRQKAHDLGFVMDNEAIDAGVRLNDAWTDLKAAGGALMKSVMIPMLPYVQEFAEWITEIAKDLQPIAKEHIPYIIEALKKLWIEVRYGAAATKIAFQTLFNLLREGWNSTLIAMAQALDEWIVPILDKLSILPGALGRMMADARDSLAQYSTDLQKNAEVDKKASQDRLDALEAEFNEIAKLREARIEALEAGTTAAAKAAKEAKNYFRQIETSAEGAAEKVKMTFGQFAMEVGRQMQQAITNLGTFINQQRQAEIDQLQRQLEAQTRIIDAQLDEQRTIREKHAQAIEDLNWKANSAITQAEYEAIQQQKDAAQAQFDEALALEEELSNQKIELQRKTSIEQAKIQRKMAETQKLTAGANAIIQIAEGIAKAFAQGGGLFGPALAAIVAAAGAIQLATIARTPLPEIPSFSKGGQVPHGDDRDYARQMGIPGPDNPYDSKLIWAQPGEGIIAKARYALFNNGMADRERMLNGANNTYNSGQNETFNQNVYIEAAQGTPFWKQREIAKKARIAFARG